MVNSWNEMQLIGFIFTDWYYFAECCFSISLTKARSSGLVMVP
jgi:hypothetical protein